MAHCILKVIFHKAVNFSFFFFFFFWGGGRGGGGGRIPTYSNLEPIYVKNILVNIKILPFLWMSNLHMHIFKF